MGKNEHYRLAAIKGRSAEAALRNADGIWPVRANPTAMLSNSQHVSGEPLPCASSYATISSVDNTPPTE